MKLCECGCGQPAPIARQTRKAHGHIAGQPMRFVSGHHNRPKPTLEDCFRKRFATGAPDQCWEWPGQRANTGYGRVSHNGKRLLAHRVSYEIHYGPIPEGQEVCHHCDNKPCVNPNHLFTGTHLDNMLDAQKKGLMSTKLTWRKARHIRQLFAKGHSQREIARRFKVSPSAINHIVHNRTWTITQ